MARKPRVSTDFLLTTLIDPFTSFNLAGSVPCKMASGLCW